MGKKTNAPAQFQALFSAEKNGASARALVKTPTVRMGERVAPKANGQTLVDKKKKNIQRGVGPTVG